MSDLSLQRSRQHGKDAQLLYINIFKSNVEKIWIKWLNLTYSYNFSESYSLNLINRLSISYYI